MFFDYFISMCCLLRHLGLLMQSATGKCLYISATKPLKKVFFTIKNHGYFIYEINSFCKYCKNCECPLSLFIEGLRWMLRSLFSIVRYAMSPSMVKSLLDCSLGLCFHFFIVPPRHTDQISQRSQVFGIALCRRSQNVFTFVFLLVRSCLLITLTTCLKGHNSRGVLYGSDFQKRQWIDERQDHPYSSCLGRLKKSPFVLAFTYLLFGPRCPPKRCLHLPERVNN